MDQNTQYIVGTLVRDPRLGSNKTDYAFFTLMCKIPSKKGERDSYQSIAAFGETAQVMGQAKKGMKIEVIAGLAELNSYTNKEGEEKQSIQSVAKKIKLDETGLPF